MVRRTHHEPTTAMQKLNHFCCSSMFGKTIVIVFRGIEKAVFVGRVRVRQGDFHVLIISKRQNEKPCLSNPSTFSEFRNVEMVSDYFFSPSRWRSSLEEIAPSFFVRDRERSMIAKNLRFVLRDTVSSSAFRIGTTAAKGFPLFTTITGSFLAFWAYFDKGSDAFFNSIFVIGRLFLHRFELDFFL